jgi:glycosyltransferase involved in cell wall biosynthesis
MAQPLPIDAVIPAYNAAPYLDDCLASIVSQTRVPRSIIVVDDGSTDGTPDIARSYGARVISGPNRGLAEARNIGVRASTAPFIAFLDADDRWYPERLEAQWGLHEHRPDLLLIASDFAVWKDGIVEGPQLDTYPAFKSLAREAVGKDGWALSRPALVDALAARNFVLPSTYLADRRIFEEYGIYFLPRTILLERDDVLIGEDFEWLMRVLRTTDLGMVNRTLVDYRVTPTSLSARRGRLRYGDAVLGKRIAEIPEVYAIGAADAFARMHTTHVWQSAISHLREGEIDYAWRRLCELARTARWPARVAYALAALVLAPPFLRRALRPLGMLPRPDWLRPLQ